MRAAGLQEGDVILFLHNLLRREDVEKMEDYLSHKMERKVIILNGNFRDIVTLPPARGLGMDVRRPTAQIDAIRRSHIRGVWYEQIFDRSGGYRK